MQRYAKLFNEHVACDTLKYKNGIDLPQVFARSGITFQNFLFPCIHKGTAQ